MKVPGPGSTLQPRLRDVTGLVGEIFDSGLVEDDEGGARPVHSEVAEPLADALYRTVLNRRPQLVVEVGMAHGMSSLAILSGLRDLGEGGRLISIDPFQKSYNNVGVTNVRRAGLADAHQLLETFDYFALPDLLRAGTTVDLAYIDGWHTVDYTLLDFWYLDRMLRPGAVVGFNDCGWRAVHKVIKFVKTHRRYREVNVGLPPDYRARSVWRSVIRRAMRWSSSDRYFEKLEHWEPNANFYAHF